MEEPKFGWAYLQKVPNEFHLVVSREGLPREISQEAGVQQERGKKEWAIWAAGPNKHRLTFSDILQQVPRFCFSFDQERLGNQMVFLYQALVPFCSFSCEIRR